MELLPLTLTIGGLALHAWLFIEIQRKEVLLTNFDNMKMIQWKNTFFYTKIIDMSIKPCSFHMSVSQSFEMFPKHNGLATV